MRYQIARRGLLWRWEVIFGPEGLALTKAAAKKRALAEIAKIEKAARHSVEHSAHG